LYALYRKVILPIIIIIIIIDIFKVA